MRADLTSMALADESNRYQLIKSVAKVTRILHRPNTRVQDTTNEAFKWLEKGVTDRDPRMVFLKVEPKWNNLRPDPRFQKIMTTMGF